MEAMYLNDWSGAGRDGMRDDFGITDDDLSGVEILLASYTQEFYSGSAFVLFRKDGKLFEVNGSHCSCHGLREDGICSPESQWKPEETTIEALSHRMEKGYGFEGANDEMRIVLAALAAAEAK